MSPAAEGRPRPLIHDRALMAAAVRSFSTRVLPPPARGPSWARERHGRTLAPDSDRTMRGVSREAAIADDGVVLSGELDHDLVAHDAAATDAARASGPAPAEVFIDRGPGYVRLPGLVSLADVDMVAS